MEELYGPDNILPCLYFDTDNVGHRKRTNLKAQKSLISFFLHRNLYKVAFARPAAGHSYINAAERCHCIANFLVGWNDDN